MLLSSANERDAGTANKHKGLPGGGGGEASLSSSLAARRRIKKTTTGEPSSIRGKASVCLILAICGVIFLSFLGHCFIVQSTSVIFDYARASSAGFACYLAASAYAFTAILMSAILIITRPADPAPSEFERRAQKRRASQLSSDATPLLSQHQQQQQSSNPYRQYSSLSSFGIFSNDHQSGYKPTQSASRTTATTATPSTVYETPYEQQSSPVFTESRNGGYSKTNKSRNETYNQSAVSSSRNQTYSQQGSSPVSSSSAPQNSGYVDSGPSRSSAVTPAIRLTDREATPTISRKNKQARDVMGRSGVVEEESWRSSHRSRASNNTGGGLDTFRFDPHHAKEAKFFEMESRSTGMNSQIMSGDFSGGPTITTAAGRFSRVDPSLAGKHREGSGSSRRRRGSRQSPDRGGDTTSSDAAVAVSLVSSSLVSERGHQRSPVDRRRPHNSNRGNRSRSRDRGGIDGGPSMPLLLSRELTAEQLLNESAARLAATIGLTSTGSKLRKPAVSQVFRQTSNKDETGAPSPRGGSGDDHDSVQEETAAVSKSSRGGSGEEEIFSWRRRGSGDVTLRDCVESRRGALSSRKDEKKTKLSKPSASSSSSEVRSSLGFQSSINSGFWE